MRTSRRAASVTDAQSFLREMNQEFADATHRCWAYVIGPAGSSDRIRRDVMIHRWLYYL